MRKESYFSIFNPKNFSSIKKRLRKKIIEYKKSLNSQN